MGGIMKKLFYYNTTEPITNKTGMIQIYENYILFIYDENVEEADKEKFVASNDKYKTLQELQKKYNMDYGTDFDGNKFFKVLRGLI
jgi:hypothetical protein